jgi:hypothetical protein
MPTTRRPQQRSDHRLRDLVQRTGDLRIATQRGVRRSAARGWLALAPTAVVSLDVVNLTESELRQEVLRLRRRVGKLAPCSGSRSPCSTPPGSGSQERACRAGVPSRVSCARWIGPASTSPCEESCGSCRCRRAGFRPGGDGRAPARSTISRPVRARHAGAHRADVLELDD